jgi:peroxiredoxin
MPPPTVPDAPQVPTLRWKNGETLPGDLALASPGSLTWKTPLFDDPIEVQWNVIDRIDWPLAPAPSKDPFYIVLRDGSFIYGDIVSVSADSLMIHSARHGDAILKRSEVLSLHRRTGANLVYAGPIGDMGWQNMANQQDGSVVRNPVEPGTASPLATAPGGALQIRSWNRSAMLDVTLPESVDAEFHVHSSKRPEFLVALGGNTREPLRVETWDNVLVLAQGDQFKIIRKVDDSERDIALRVCWNMNQHQCSVFNPAGELLTSWKVPGPIPTPRAPGLILQNRGLDLSLDLLRVRVWDGKSPPKIDPNQPRIELDDGRTIFGAITAGTQGSINVQAPGQPTANYPLHDVDAVVFSSDLPQAAAHDATLSYNDGTLIFGQIASIDHGQASFATSFTNGPLTSKMDSPRQILVISPQPVGAAPEVPLDQQNKIVIQDTTLHGNIGVAGDGALGWLPVGGLKAARPSKSLGSEITLAVPKDATPPGDPALFYLTSGDILPGSLKSLDRSGVEFESSLMAARKLPSTSLEAIEFSPSGLLNIQSFSDPAWEIIKGDPTSVRRKANTVEMDAGTSIGLASLMQCGEFSFKCPSNGFSAFRVRMFCAGKDDSHSINILLCNSGAQFTVGQELTPGQIDGQFQVGFQPGQPVAVRFKIDDSNVDVFVNGAAAGQFPIDPSNCAGSGVIFEPASIWGNGVATVSLSDFATHITPGRTWVPEVSPEIKNQVLTVPRFAKDDPPRQLLIGANGDVLRGEIQAATDSHFGFRCGLENLTVPRDRVRAVIWLQPPAQGGSAPAPTPDIPVSSNPLNDRLPMRNMFGQIDLANVIGFLRSQDNGLKIQVPPDAGERRVGRLSVGGQTMGAALAAICARFNLHYRLDPDNTIVLESSTTLTDSRLVSRTYWLKPDAIPANGSARDILSARGITFPKNATVEWQSQAGTLTLLDTEDNQAKLAAVIASDWGGSLGSPTHWLELTSGGRLALAVDKFEPDFITAHHPFYGAIKVPMSQICVIRSTPPPVTPTSLALKNWRLVNAPEPVIPSGNSENSPLLGKDADAFSLPLLTGGGFDLASEKGHIVILDFWASWCGPCIKSLPGLIDAISAFPSDRVKLIGVNQGESPSQVKSFLETRGLKLVVAMDSDQTVGRKYGVDAIPRTIIVGPDGKVAWDQTGYDPDGDSAAADAIKKMLNPAPADPPAK